MFDIYIIVSYASQYYFEEKLYKKYTVCLLKDGQILRDVDIQSNNFHQRIRGWK